MWRRKSLSKWFALMVAIHATSRPTSPAIADPTPAVPTTSPTTAPASSTVRSADETIELVMPPDWRVMTEEIYRSYQLYVSNDAKVLAVGIRAFMKDDVAANSPEEVEDQFKSDFNTMLTDVRFGEPKAIDLPNGHRAVQREVRGVQNGRKWIYQFTVIETSKQFIAVYSCTMPSRFEAARGEFDQIVRSIRDLK